MALYNVLHDLNRERASKGIRILWPDHEVQALYHLGINLNLMNLYLCNPQSYLITTHTKGTQFSSTLLSNQYTHAFPLQIQTKYFQIVLTKRCLAIDKISVGIDHKNVRHIQMQIAQLNKAYNLWGVRLILNNSQILLTPKNIHKQKNILFIHFECLQEITNILCYTTKYQPSYGSSYSKGSFSLPTASRLSFAMQFKKMKSFLESSLIPEEEKLIDDFQSLSMRFHHKKPLFEASINSNQKEHLDKILLKQPEKIKIQASKSHQKITSTCKQQQISSNSLPKQKISSIESTYLPKTAEPSKQLLQRRSQALKEDVIFKIKAVSHKIQENPLFVDNNNLMNIKDDDMFVFHSKNAQFLLQRDIVLAFCALQSLKNTKEYNFKEDKVIIWEQFIKILNQYQHVNEVQSVSQSNLIKVLELSVKLQCKLYSQLILVEITTRPFNLQGSGQAWMEAYKLTRTWPFQESQDLVNHKLRSYFTMNCLAILNSNSQDFYEFLDQIGKEQAILLIQNTLHGCLNFNTMTDMLDILLKISDCRSLLQLGIQLQKDTISSTIKNAKKKLYRPSIMLNIDANTSQSNNKTIYLFNCKKQTGQHNCKKQTGQHNCKKQTGQHLLQLQQIEPHPLSSTQMKENCLKQSGHEINSKNVDLDWMIVMNDAIEIAQSKSLKIISKICESEALNKFRCYFIIEQKACYFYIHADCSSLHHEGYQMKFKSVSVQIQLSLIYDQEESIFENIQFSHTFALNSGVDVGFAISSLNLQDFLGKKAKLRCKAHFSEVIMQQALLEYLAMRFNEYLPLEGNQQDEESSANGRLSMNLSKRQSTHNIEELDWNCSKHICEQCFLHYSCNECSWILNQDSFLKEIKVQQLLSLLLSPNLIVSHQWHVIYLIIKYSLISKLSFEEMKDLFQTCRLHLVSLNRLLTVWKKVKDLEILSIIRSMITWKIQDLSSSHTETSNFRVLNALPRANDEFWHYFEEDYSEAYLEYIKSEKISII